MFAWAASSTKSKLIRALRTHATVPDLGPSQGGGDAIEDNRRVIGVQEWSKVVFSRVAFSVNVLLLVDS